MKRVRRFQVLQVLGPALMMGMLGAQEPGEQGKDKPEPPVPVDVDADRRGAPVRPLTLEDALRLGRGNNADLRAAELLPEQARLDLTFAEAGFEPELFANTTYSNSESPERLTTFGFDTAERTTLSIDGEMGWRQRTITGGLFDLAYRPGRLSSRSSQGLNRSFTSEFAASYRQPLLRGAWTDYNLAAVNRARLAYAQARQDFAATVQGTLQDVVAAYWELVFERENWRVVVSALEVAREQLRITEERIRVGDLAPPDRVEAEAEVARREEELITAENAIRTREDNLRRLLFDPSDTRFWEVNLRPVSEIEVTPSLEERPFEPLVAVALANRPELRSRDSRIAQSEIALMQATSDALPSLDLIGSWSTDGSREQFHRAFRDASNLEYPDWTVGVEFAIPLGNHAARAARERAGLELERQRRELHAARLEVTREVRQAARDLGSLAQSIRASGESVRLAETNLETERVRLRVGSSTAFEVQRRNQDLREARSRHLRNQLDYRVAESRLLFVQGILEPPR